jgi:putative transposase
MTERWFTSSDLAAFALPELPATKPALLAKAARENWPSRPREGRGGGREYPISALPQAARDALAKKLAGQALRAGRAAGRQVALAVKIDEISAARGREAGLADLPSLSGDAKIRAEARGTVLFAYRQYAKQTGRAASTAAELFAAAWERGEIQADPGMRAALPRFTGRSVLNWDKAVSKAGAARLAGRYGLHRKGTGVLDTDTELQDFVLAMILEHQDVRPKLVMRGLRAHFAEDRLPSYRTLQRWMTDWRAEHRSVDRSINAPDAWRSSDMFGFGNAGAGITALNQRWEMDSTKADLLLADGGRHVIVGVIDVWSRRMKLLVSRSSSSAAVCALLRGALLDWGVPDQIGTDNGSDYVSIRVQGVINSLDIDQRIAPPFTPQAKPFIERGLGTFNHDLIELLAGYVGHSVAERKRIESRKSFADRMMKSGETVREAQHLTAEELQKICDLWTDTHYQTDRHSGLSGLTPFARAASWTGAVKRIENVRALDVLLAEPAGRNPTVTKKCITIGRATYGHAALGAYVGRRVRALWDEANIGRIYVFDEDGKFICEAECPELIDSGVSRQELATQMKKSQREAIADEKAKLKAASKRATARGMDAKSVARDIMMQKAEEAGKLVVLPRAFTPHLPPALSEAARIHADPTPIPLAPAVAARRALIEAEIAKDFAAPATVTQLETPDIRFKRACSIEKAQAEGRAVTAEDAAWLKRYQHLSEYRGRKALQEDFPAQQQA